jgi:hypothetical protein
LGSLGRQDSQPVFIAAKSLISLAQKSRFAAEMYSELAQFFKLVLSGTAAPYEGPRIGIFWVPPCPVLADGGLTTFGRGHESGPHRTR